MQCTIILNGLMRNDISSYLSEHSSFDFSHCLRPLLKTLLLLTNSK